MGANVDESNAQKVYHHKYNEEVQLNINFNQFMVKLKKAYCGVNTREEQLERVDWPHDQAHEMYTEEEGSDEALPLGHEFQAFVDVFVNYDRAHSATLTPDVDVVVKQFLVSHKLAASLSAEEHDRQNDVSVRLLCVL